MYTISRGLIGIVSILLSFHLSSVLITPICDIAHNLLNESVPDLPPLSFYVYRSLSLYTTPLALFVLLFGILLGYSRFLVRTERIGLILFFAFPSIVSIISMIYISATDFSEQGMVAILQGIIRALDFMSPFVLAWVVAPITAKFYEKITGEF